MSVPKACGVVLNARSAVMGRAPAVAEEPIALFRCQKGNGCPAFFL